MKTRTLFYLLIMLAFCLNPLFAQWEKVPMPGSRSGIVYSVCFKGDKMFAGIQGGVYVSSDDGEHWQKVNPDLPPREYKAFAASIVVNDEKVIAAFNEPGVYSTSDDGLSWEMASIDAGIRSTPIKIAADGDWIIGGNMWQSGFTFQSTDNGLTWNQVNELSNVYSVAMKDSTAIVYNGTDIYLSTDYGTTWESVYQVTSNSYFGSSVAISESNVIAGIGNDGESRILLSTNNGLTWNQQSNLNCSSINAIVFGPEGSGNNYMFAATDNGIFRSSNNGLNWAEINDGLTSGFITSLAFKISEPVGSQALYAGTGNGIFCSKDYGETWTSLSSPSEWLFAYAGSQLIALSSNSSFSGGGSWLGLREDIYYNMVFRSTDNGLNWTNTYSGYLNNNFQITSFDASIDGSGNVSLYATIAGIFPEIIQPYGMVITSDDLGESWRNVYPDSTNSKIALKTIFTSVFLSIVSTGATAFIRSTDKGNTWEQIDSNFVSAICFENDSYYAGGDYEFVIPNPNPPPHFLRYHRKYLINSIDNGANWLTLESSLDSAIRFDGLKTDTLSILTSLYTKSSHLLTGMRANYFYESPYAFPFAYGGGLIHLIQSGSNWVVTDSSFVGRSVFNFESIGNDIFAATDSGVFHSNNYGTTWDDISSGMNNIYTSSLFKSGQYLYASTINGLWKRPLSEITSIENPDGGEIPGNYFLSQNYPNPFNPSTKINYSIPEDGFISLKVYNILGEQVALIFEGFRKAGIYESEFISRDLACGIYIYQLHARNIYLSKKLILLK